MTYPNAPPPPPPQSMGSNNIVYITELRFDPDYVKTHTGIIKCVCIIFSLISIICIQASSFWWEGRGVFFTIVACLSLFFSLALVLVYLFHVAEKYHNFKWLKVELVGSVILVFLNLISSTIVVAFGSAAFSAAGFFGYLCMVLYGLDAFLKVRALQAGELAQGRRRAAKQPHAPPAPPALP